MDACVGEGRQTGAGGLHRRHVCCVQLGDVWRDQLLPDHQPTTVCHPWRWRYHTKGSHGQRWYPQAGVALSRCVDLQKIVAALLHKGAECVAHAGTSDDSYYQL